MKKKPIFLFLTHFRIFKDISKRYVILRKTSSKTNTAVSNFFSIALNKFSGLKINLKGKNEKCGSLMKFAE